MALTSEVFLATLKVAVTEVKGKQGETKLMEQSRTLKNPNLIM